MRLVSTMLSCLSGLSGLLMATTTPAWAQAQSPVGAQSLDANVYYRLSTQFRGPDMDLDVFNGGPKNNLTHLQPKQDVSGQYWKFMPAGEGNFWRMTTLFRGPGMCLDIFNGGANNNQPHLTECANFSGQFWNIRPDGSWLRLTTKFRGPDMCLDIFNGGENNNQPHLVTCANFSGQNWQLATTEKK